VDVVGQFGMTGEDQGQNRLGVELEGGQKTQLLQQGCGDVLCFIQDQDRGAPGLSEGEELGSDAGPGVGGGPGGLGPQFGEQIEVELAGRPRRVSDGQHAVAGGVVLGQQGPQQRRLATAGLPTKAADLALGEDVGEPGEGLLVQPRQKDAQGGDVAAEGGRAEAEVLLKQRARPLSFWPAGAPSR
jgi:hypothetical protein